MNVEIVISGKIRAAYHPVTTEELSIPEEKLRRDILREIFIKAEEIETFLMV